MNAPLDPSLLAAPFIGEVEEICIVTANLERTARGLLRLGIGPWKLLEIHPRNTAEQTYRGRPARFSIRVGFAQVGRVVLELMQPLDGPSIFADHLATKGEGLHHVSFSLNGVPWSERIEQFRARGFAVAQSGIWLGGVKFAFFDTERAIGASFETYLYPADYSDPAGEVTWFPHPPVQ